MIWLFFITIGNMKMYQYKIRYIELDNVNVMRTFFERIRGAFFEPHKNTLNERRCTRIPTIVNKVQAYILISSFSFTKFSPMNRFFISKRRCWLRFSIFCLTKAISAFDSFMFTFLRYKTLWNIIIRKTNETYSLNEILKKNNFLLIILRMLVKIWKLTICF